MLLSRHSSVDKVAINKNLGIEALNPSDRDTEMTESHLTPHAVKAQLDKLLSSSEFSRSKRLKEFLQFLVSETLAGRSKNLKEYTVAVEVFGKDRSFDPKESNIVRVEAGRLRRVLDQYYLSTGKNDPVKIEIPKGTYAPTIYPVTPINNEELGQQSPYPSVMVFPLDNQSGDSELTYFTDGLTEDLITHLNRFHNLQVIACQTEQSVDQNIRFKLQGSIRCSGNTIRISTQLLDVMTGGHLWSDIYDRELTAGNLFNIQDDIAEKVAATIAAPFGVLPQFDLEKTRIQKTEALSAYEHVLRVYEYYRVPTIERHAPVLKGLEHAVSTDPHYADAWAWLAELCLDEYRFGIESEGLSLPRAFQAAQRALELEPMNQLAHQALSDTYYFQHELDRFVVEAERAIAINPNNVWTLAFLSTLFSISGKYERGLALAKRAISLNPNCPAWINLTFFHYHYAQQAYEQALAFAHKAYLPNFYRTHMRLAATYGKLGRREEAAKEVESLLKLKPNFDQWVCEEFNRWNLPEQQSEDLIDGLIKAGLKVAY